MIHIVIPIGVSTPGTPVLSLLEKSINSIQNQTFKDFKLTIASDDDVSDECKKLLESKNVDVEWFSPATFFRKGGIWKKIKRVWDKSDTKYVCFMHYDDLWDSRKLEFQIELMEKKNLYSSWSETYIIDKDDMIVSQDLGIWNRTNKELAGTRTVAFAHSSIVKRAEFYDSGIMEFEDVWSPVFEDLYAIFIQKIGNGEKSVGSKFYWRNHDMNMTNSILCDTKWKDLMEEQRIIGEYSNNEVNEDASKLYPKMLEIVTQIKNS